MDLPASIARSRERIAIVGSYPPPHGGQSVHIANLRRYLVEHGRDVYVLNTGKDKSIAEPGIKSVSSSRELLAALLDGTLRLVHVHVADTEDYRKLAPVALAARLKGYPWLATIHSGNSGALSAAAGRARRWASALLLRGAARLVCVNHAIEKELATLTGLDTAVTITPFSLGRAAGSLPASLEQFVAAHDPVFCCIGTYEPVYGFDAAVLALGAIRASYPRAGLVLIGDTSNAAWCKELVAQRGLEQDVALCGNLQHEQCLTILSRATLFLRPTLYDGDSLSVREALALGVPVVASTTDFRPPGVALYRRDVSGDLAAKMLDTLAAAAKPGAPSPVADDRSLARIDELYTTLLAGA